MSGENRYISVVEDIVLREEEEGAFLFNPNTGRICFLNEIGTDVWRLCGKVAAADQIISRISVEYPDIPSEQISRDCLQFLKELEKMGFLSLGPAD